MSLRIWLPLNGTLKNQGLGEDTLTVVGNSVTINDNGKMGKCYNFGTADGYLDITTTEIKKLSNFCSVAFWVKILSFNTNYSTIFSCTTINSSWQRQILTFQRDINTSTYTFHIADGTNSTTNVCKTDNLQLDTWYHFVLTMDVLNKQMKIYKNGSLITTYNTSIVPDYNSVQYFRIGKSHNSYQGHFLLNDFRLYDNILSLQQVKQISQGLVLHFPLNNKGFGQENLILNTAIQRISPESSSGSAFVSPTPFLSSKGQFLLTNTESYFTLSFDYKVTGNSKTDAYIYAQARGTYIYLPILNVNVYNNPVGHYKNTFRLTDTQANSTYNSMNIRLRYATDGSVLTVKNIKLEIGNKETSWSPSSEDDLYTTLELDNNVVYDISGFGNNGVSSGDITVNPDTPKYSVSTHIGATNAKIHISGFPTIGFGDSYSFAWWAKVSNVNPMHWGFYNGIRVNGLYTGRLWNTSDGAKNPLYIPGTTTQVSTPTINTWHHWVMTGDGTTCKVYQDGEFWGQAKTYKSISGTSIYINGWSSGTDYSSDDMDISDFRIYSTALSAEEVKSLYNNKAYIDENNIIHGEIRE